MMKRTQSRTARRGRWLICLFYLVTGSLGKLVVDYCVPPCQIAACCKEKNYRTCAERGEMETCDKLSKDKANLQAIRDKGLDA